MNRIVVSSDIKQALEIVVGEIGSNPRVVFEADEFLIDNSRALIDEAYIASEKEKYLIAVANRYRDEAQNALLKVFEEPPRNIKIVLIAPRKSIFLPTIRSRATIKYIKSVKPKIEAVFDFNNLTLDAIYNYIKNYHYQSKEDSRFLVEQALEYYSKTIKKFPNKQILDAIQRTYWLIGTNSPSHLVILPLLLLLLEEKNRGSKTSR